MGDRSVEAAGEGDRCGVADRELHRRNCADPAADQRRRRTREQILHPGLSRGAGIQHHQSGCGFRVAQQGCQTSGLYQVGPAVGADQGDKSLLGSDVVVAVPDKVQDVPLAAEESAVDAFPAGLRYPDQLHQSRGNRLSQRLGQVLLLGVHIQGR